MRLITKAFAQGCKLSQIRTRLYSQSTEVIKPQHFVSFVRNWRSTSVVASMMENDKILTAPLTYLLNKPGPMTRTIMIALNHWLEIPEDKLEKFITVMVELQENALLLDDMIDESPLRRGRPSSYIVHGVIPTFNSAVFNYYRIQEKYFEAGNHDPKIIKDWTETMMNIYEADGIEKVWTRDGYCPTEKEFLLSVMKKNGAYPCLMLNLMQSASKNKTDFNSFMELLSGYGQLRDDYEGLFYPERKYTDSEVFADDISTGRYTLPLVHAIRTKKNKEVEEILKSKPKDMETKRRCVDILKDIGSMDYSKQVLTEIDETLSKEVKKFGPNPIFEMAMESLRDWQDPETKDNVDCKV